MIESLHSGRTPFDHVAVAFSMVMSLAVVRLLDGLRPALASRAGWWVQATWVTQKLVAVALCWWIFWWMRTSVTWTATTFLWMLMSPALLFLQASALVTTHPLAIESWRAHFLSTRRWFFAIEGAFVLHSLLTSTLLRGVPARDPLRIVQGMAVVTATIGIASARPRVHALLAPIALITEIVGLSYCFYRP